MILSGTAAVCSISTSKMWPECPSKDIGRSEPIAEGEDDNHHFDDDEQNRDKSYAANDGGGVILSFSSGPCWFYSQLEYPDKNSPFSPKESIYSIFAGVSLNTQIPVSIEKKKNCANMRQFKNATISCD